MEYGGVSIEMIRQADVVFADGCLVWGRSLMLQAIKQGRTVEALTVRLRDVDVGEAEEKVRRIKTRAYDGPNRTSGGVTGI